MAFCIYSASDTWVKSESEKEKLYKAALTALETSGPMTIDQLADAIPFPRARISQACQTMRVVGDAHIGSWVVGDGGVRIRCYHAGPGVDVESPFESRKKNNPLLPAKILAVLTRPMTVQDVMKEVFYTRPAIQHHLQLLCASGVVRIYGQVTQQGGTTLIYSRAGALEASVGVEEGVVIPHSLSDASCDAENI